MDDYASMAFWRAEDREESWQGPTVSIRNERPCDVHCKGAEGIDIIQEERDEEEKQALITRDRRRRLLTVNEAFVVMNVTV